VAARRGGVIGSGQRDRAFNTSNGDAGSGPAELP